MALTLPAEGSVGWASTLNGILQCFGGIATTTANSAAINTTDTLICGGNTGTQLPASQLTVGTLIRVTLYGVCTSTAANTVTFTLRYGAAGTTADASFATITPTSGTSGPSLPFTVVVDFVVTATGATGAVHGRYQILNQGNTTGIVTVPILTGSVSVSSTLDTTIAGYFSVSFKTTNTTTTATFLPPCFIEIIKP